MPSHMVECGNIKELQKLLFSSEYTSLFHQHIFHQSYVAFPERNLH